MHIKNPIDTDEMTEFSSRLFRTIMTKMEDGPIVATLRNRSTVKVTWQFAPTGRFIMAEDPTIFWLIDGRHEKFRDFDIMEFNDEGSY